MNGAAKWIARWRVRLGYPLAVVVLFFARPNWKSVAVGAAVGVVGLWLRAYAFTRNPLYLGSAVLAAGAAWAMHSWISGIVLGVYFSVVYYIVMRREEGELRGHFGDAFEMYARTVPLFFPRITPAKIAGSSPCAFSFAQYKKNHEYQATLGFFFLLAMLTAIWRLHGR
jgi:protein-S-isoprenylcysteine O-methyltransferase Ste14